MSVIDLVKMHSSPQKGMREDWEKARNSRGEVNGLAIHIEDCRIPVYVQKPIDLRERFNAFLVSTRQKLISYRLRAVILVLLSRLRDYNYIDQVLGAGIIVMVAMLWERFFLVERGRTIIKSHACKSGYRRSEQVMAPKKVAKLMGTSELREVRMRKISYITG